MNKPLTRKRRTGEHVIATVERPRHDDGYDLSLTAYDANGEPEDGKMQMQLKATDALSLSSCRDAATQQMRGTDHGL